MIYVGLGLIALAALLFIGVRQERIDTEPYFELEYKRHFFDIQVHKFGVVALFSVSPIPKEKMTLKSLRRPS